MSRVRLAFFGTPHFACVGLQALLENDAFEVAVVVTQPDRPAGRGGKVVSSPVKELAMAHGVPVLQPSSIRRELDQWLPQLAQFGPLDVGVVIAFGQILPLAVLQYPRAGCINVHASLLPRWRGAAPIQRALLAGDPVTGVGLMQMEEGLDTGPVFVQQETAISDNDTAGTLHDRLATIGASLLLHHLPEIVQGQRTATPQPSEGVTYAHKLTNEEAQIDWSRGADEIDRLVRALSPVPGAFTFIHNERLKIRAGTVHESGSTVSGAEVGTLSVIDDALVVQCGRGVYQVREIQPAGKRVMRADEFVHGVRSHLPLQLASGPS